MGGRKRIAIVGAGLGGLSAAATLARDFEVIVLERSAEVGGKVRAIDIAGMPVDCGPTVFTMRWAFEEAFAAAGARLEDELVLRKLDILARHGWPGGARLDLHADKARSADAIGAFAGSEDARNYLAFCEDARRIYETLRDPFLRAARPSMGGLIASRNPVSLIGIQPFSTMWSAVARRFRDPRLAQLFARYATYCGSSPFAAPATLMLIAHVEQDGVYALDGGMRALAAAFERVALRNGAEIRLNQEVAAIRSARGRVSSLALASGEEIPADAVIFNGDCAAIAAGLLGEAARDAIATPRDADASLSAVTLAFAAGPGQSPFAMHTVLFADDYRGEFDAIFQHRRIASAPTVYAYAPARAPGAALPSGREAFFCLVNAPAEGRRQTLQPEEIDACRRHVFAHLARCGFPVDPDPASIVTTTPGDFAGRFPGTGGALYGMASHGWRASFQRPGARTRLPGLYLAGGSVHPGPGTPMATLSGQAAAAAIRADLASTRLSLRAVMRGGISTP